MTFDLDGASRYDGEGFDKISGFTLGRSGPLPSTGDVNLTHHVAETSEGKMQLKNVN